MKVDTLNFDLTVVNAAAEVGKRDETTTAVASVSPPPPPSKMGKLIIGLVLCQWCATECLQPPYSWPICMQLRCWSTHFTNPVVATLPV